MQSYLVDVRENAFGDQNEILLMKVILHRLINKDRNEQLSVLDGLANLVESDCIIALCYLYR